MSDSLVVAGVLELLGGGVASVNPMCPGAKFRLQPGFDMGAPQPTTDFVASLLLDGERPFGRRSSNRLIKLPIWISAPDRQILASARELLEQAADQDTWTLMWTRDPGPGGTPLPLIIDCFRAQPTVPTYNTLFEREITGLQVTLTIPALPFGRSDVQQQISFAAPVPTSPVPPPPPSPVVLDAFTQISSSQCTQSTQCAVGPYTCCWDPDFFGDLGGQVTPLTYGATFASPLDLTAMQSLQMWLGFGSRYYVNLEYHGKAGGVAVAVTLTDSNGVTLPLSRSNLLLPVSPSAQSPVFSRVTLPITQGAPVFDYGTVVSYEITITNRQDYVRRLSWVTAYLDALTAYPGSTTVNPVTRGSLLTMYGLAGTARSAASMSFQQAPTPGTPTTITAAGAGTYTVPANTAWVKAECTGGGGAGAGLTGAGVGPGGGGAEYAAEIVFPCSPGQVVPYVVGTGDTPGTAPPGGLPTVFGPAPGGTLQVIANGGGSVPANGTVAGQGGQGSLNAVEYPGGAGRANPAGTFGGGGGSSGGYASAGNTPVGSGSVLFTAPGTYSGGSGWLCPAGVFQVLAEVWGGGGSGAGGVYGPYGSGGSGGQYRNAYITTVPGTYYTVVVAAGGAAVTSGHGNAAGSSSFTGAAGAQVVAAGGLGGLNNWNSYGPAGASGGSGSGAVYNGGAGGPGYPYAGGGGSGAGPAAPGNQGYSNGAGIAPSGGGNGGQGSGPNSNAGTAGQAPGGAGGGSYATGAASGAGAAGQVRLTYPASTGAPTAAGGIAVPGGGSGAPGGAAAGDAGSTGYAPGGGGSGAYSSGSTLAGGAGGTGQIRITPYSSAPFKNLIVHRPPLGALKTFQPLVSVGGGNDTPNGGTQYQMPQPLTGVSADFGGTYTVLLVNAGWNGTGNRTVYVTVTQYEFAGGASYSVSTAPVTVTPSQVVNGVLTAGVLTLPVKAVAPDNTGGYYTVSVTDSNTSDRFYDCLFLDTMGQTAIINEPSDGYVTYYLDAPDPNLSLGNIMGSQFGRADAISVVDQAVLSGGPMIIEPADGDNQLFVYSADASAPNVSVAYYANYFFDRVS